jgi:hypothetical protein
MPRRLFLLGAAAAVLGLAAFWFLTIPATVPTDALGSHTPDLANGKTIFLAGGCSACHAVPRQEDSTKLGGGLGLVSKFGTFYVPNISPDTKDGIGAWTEAQFVTAMTKGTSPAGEHLFPVFPYTSFQKMKSDDLRDLFAHIKTLPPVAGKVRDHEVPFPLNIRRLVGVWKLLYLDGEPFKPDPSEVGAMESRRLPGQRARPLRRMPQPTQYSWRHRSGQTLLRHSKSPRQGRLSEYHSIQLEELVGGRYRRNA